MQFGVDSGRGASIGIIGGLGPLAGAHVYERFVSMTPAVSDQDHPRVLLLSYPFPSRLNHLASGSMTPLPDLIEAAWLLKQAGCRVIGLASATTHAYRLAIETKVGVPVVDGLQHLASELESSGVHSATVLCTSAARDAGLYDSVWPETVAINYPSSAEQRLIDHMISQVKEFGVRRLDVVAMGGFLGRYSHEGASCVLGCTELPLLSARSYRGNAVVSISDSIAGALLEKACALGITEAPRRLRGPREG